MNAWPGGSPQLFAALLAARRKFKPPTKTGYNKYDQYEYATLADYIGAVDAALSEAGVLVLATVEQVQRLDTRSTKSGHCEYVVVVCLRMCAIHADSGSSLSITSWGEGQDRGDKALNKAVTAARKNGLALMLNLVATDDPERDSSGDTDGAQPYTKAAAFLKELQ